MKFVGFKLLLLVLTLLVSQHFSSRLSKKKKHSRDDAAADSKITDGCVLLWSKCSFQGVSIEVCEDVYDFKLIKTTTWTGAYPASVQLGKYITASFFYSAKYVGKTYGTSKNIDCFTSSGFSNSPASMKINHIREYTVDTKRVELLSKEKEREEAEALKQLEHDRKAFLLSTGMGGVRVVGENNRLDEFLRMQRDGDRRLPIGRGFDYWRRFENPHFRNDRNWNYDARDAPPTPPVASESSKAPAAATTFLETGSKVKQPIPDFIDYGPNHPVERIPRPREMIHDYSSFELEDLSREQLFQALIAEEQYRNILGSRLFAVEQKLERVLNKKKHNAIACWESRIELPGDNLLDKTRIIWNRVLFNKDPGVFYLNADRTTVEVFDTGLYHIEAKITSSSGSNIQAILDINQKQSIRFNASAASGNSQDASLSYYTDMKPNDHFSIFIASTGNGPNNVIVDPVNRLCIRKLD